MYPLQNKTIHYEHSVLWELSNTVHLTVRTSVVKSLVCQSSGPGLIPGMARSELAITKGNLIMLLPSTMILSTTSLA